MLHHIASTPHPRQAGTSESSDRYPSIRLNNDHRVIVCPAGVQWIVQVRHRRGDRASHWEGKSFCRSKEALLLCVRAAGRIDPVAYAILNKLPAWIERAPLKVLA